MSDNKESSGPQNNTYSDIFQYSLTPDESVSLAIPRAVAAVIGVRPTDLDPLATVIDPDALECLFNLQKKASVQGVTELTFHYNDCEIIINNTGQILIKTT